MPVVSASDLGEAAKAVALQRLSSTDSDGIRDNVYETAGVFGGPVSDKCIL